MMLQPRTATRRGRIGIYWRDAAGRHFAVCADEGKRAELVARLEAARSPDTCTVPTASARSARRMETRVPTVTARRPTISATS